MEHLAGQPGGRGADEGNLKTRFYPAGLGSEIVEGQARGLVVNGWPVLIARVDGRLLATINRCTHAASALAEGRVRRGLIMCPLHGARFDLATGDCLGGIYKSLMTFELREAANGEVEVAVPDPAPGAEHLPVRD